eukprot:jgi/Ulvmu1/4275/UM197_0002.1
MLQPARRGSTWNVVLKNIPIVPGFPACCHRHQHERVITAPGGFEEAAPDGGCLLRCAAELGCGHKCTLRCHSERQPHSKCEVMIDCKCAAGLHDTQRLCSAAAPRPCQEDVPELCRAKAHIVFRKCGSRVAPPCVAMVHSYCEGFLAPVGADRERHLLPHKCCDAPPRCRHCLQLRRKQQELHQIEERLQRQLEQAKEASLAEQSLADIAKAHKMAKSVSESAPKAECISCFDEVSYLEGVACPAKDHFMCNDCFAGWVLSESAPADGHVPKAAGEIWCMYKADVRSAANCKSDRPFHPREVALHSSPKAYEAYLGARDRVREAAQADQHLREMKAFEERLRKELNDQVTPVRKLIIEKVLTPHCPRCQAAFLDFDGCLALTCRRPECGCAFCAVCLKDCGSDAHGHIGSCKYANGSLHAATGEIRQLENQWRTDRIKEILQPLGLDLKARVLESLARELQDLGLSVGSFK